jgi:hypothetical protein
MYCMIDLQGKSAVCAFESIFITLTSLNDVNYARMSKD